MKIIHIDRYFNRFELINFLKENHIRTNPDWLNELIRQKLFPQPELLIFGRPKGVCVNKLWLEEKIKQWVNYYNLIWPAPDTKARLIRTSQAIRVKQEFGRIFDGTTERIHYAALPWRVAELLGIDGLVKIELVDVVESEPEAKPEPQEEAQKPSENAIPSDNPALASVFISPVLNDQLVQLRISIETRCGELKGSLEAVLDRLRTIEAKIDTLALDFKHSQQKDNLTVDNILEDLEKNP